MISIKSQVATEYLVIVGLALIILIPLTILYSRYSGESSYAVTTSKVDSISKEIISNANQVNVYGKDTQVKLSLDFPQGIESISFSGNEIMFTIKNNNNEISEIVKVADTQFVTRTYPTITAGRKNVIVKSLGNSVDVQFACRLDSDCNPGQSCKNSICST
ncbi:MAG: hypothetical protein AABX61_03190 [Nanoarchaeota archaeon]